MLGLRALWRGQEPAFVSDPEVVVLDDLSLGGDPRVLEEWLERKPAVRLYVTSREPVPKGVARHCGNGTGVCLGNRDLALTPEEVENLCQHDWGWKLSREDTTWLAHFSAGWVAGLVMLRESALIHPAASIQNLPELAEDTLLAYLEEELLAPVPAFRQFLQETSLPETCDVQTAVDGCPPDRKRGR
jgi:ATP/maltotriose-dependent transcriptional regulator MalT